MPGEDLRATPLLWMLGIAVSLAALGLLGVPLLTYPLLSLPQGEIAGIPAPYLYLFGMWTLLIVLAAVIAERRGK